MTATVTPGTKLGPYEILDPIGKGGMGEVFRAKDERLGRTVAVKVLPKSFAADKDRLRRFELEARAAGQLNHPNIIAIHDVGAENGLPYIVTELLEGQDVRGLLAQGPIPPRKAIDYVVQAASGLAAAHGKGIAHRDLKPENLFVNPAGHVKILDFGLAKLTRREDGPKGPHDETGAQLSATMTGQILGTASYMSPEQIREQPTDHRTDIFSLGCILYEMLAGRRAFDGPTPIDRMTAILTSDPPDAPPAIEEAVPGINRVIHRCLEKSAENRFESARELAFALGLVTERSGVARAASDAAASGAGVAPTSGFAVKLRRITYREGIVHTACFAPDGQAVCYAAAWEGKPMELFWSLPGNPESRPLGFPDSRILSIAPGGEMAVTIRTRFLGGFVATGMLARMPLGGGAPRPVQDGVMEACWSPDGRQFAIVREVGGMRRIEYPIGKVIFQTTGWPSDVRISPDGKLIAFLDHPARGSDAGSAAVVDLQGNARILSSGWSSTQGLAWSPDGTRIYFTAFRTEAARCLFSVTLNGELRPVFQTPGHLILQDISRNGDLLIVHGHERLRMQHTGPGDTTSRDLSWLDWSLVRDISRDGRFVLFDETGVGGGENHSVYMRDVDGSPAVRLGDGMMPRLSPDGRWAVAKLYDPNRPLFLLPIGAGEVRSVPTVGLSCHAAAWFPDGKRLCSVGSEGQGGLRAYEIDVETGAHRPFTEEGVGPYDTVLSHDGKLWGGRAPDQTFKLYTVDGSAPPRPVEGVEALDRPIRWSEDGKALFVFTRGVVPAPVIRVDLETGERRIVREIAPSDPTGVGGITHASMTPDGSAIAYSYHQGLGDLYVIEGLR
jgi:Tol biopolymer transport system component